MKINHCPEITLRETMGDAEGGKTKRADIDRQGTFKRLEKSPKKREGVKKAFEGTLEGEGIEVVFFSARWCGGCKDTQKVLDELKKETGQDYRYVDTDKVSGLKGHAKEYFTAVHYAYWMSEGIPTTEMLRQMRDMPLLPFVMVFKDGKPVAMMPGGIMDGDKAVLFDVKFFKMLLEGVEKGKKNIDGIVKAWRMSIGENVGRPQSQYDINLFSGKREMAQETTFQPQGRKRNTA